jgi:hypothetical protein
VKRGEKVRVLRAARERLKKGWCKGTLYRNADLIAKEPEKFCAIGALRQVLTGAADNYNRDSEIRSLLGFEVGQSIAVWNDAPERTHASVLQRFAKRAAQIERGEA